MRLDPSAGQIRLDKLSYMDVMRMLRMATGAISFHQFAMEVLGLPEVTGAETGPEFHRGPATQ